MYNSCASYGSTQSYSMQNNAYDIASSYQAMNSGYEVHAAVYTSSYEQQAYTQPEQHAAFIADTFLAPNRPETPITSNTESIQHIIDETFEKITGQSFPKNDINIMILPVEKLKAIHNQVGGRWSDGIMGFSFNKFGKGTSEIFVREDHLDSVLLTLGHEIGHVLSPTLPNAQDEEAKAHAFSLAWIETIRDNNIAGLQPNILPNPAKNGIHDVGWNFVQKLLQTGASAFDIFKTLSTGLTSMLGG